MDDLLGVFEGISALFEFLVELPDMLESLWSGVAGLTRATGRGVRRTMKAGRRTSRRARRAGQQLSHMRRWVQRTARALQCRRTKVGHAVHRFGALAVRGRVHAHPRGLLRLRAGVSRG